MAEEFHGGSAGGYKGTVVSGGTATSGYSFGTGGGGDFAGGGGGWYGGTGSNGSGGSGGSGYVYTAATASQYPSGCLLNSSYYLTDASTTAGQWSGNGKATITLVE